MNRRKQMGIYRAENKRIVEDCLSSSDFKYFTCKKICRLTGLLTGKVRVGLGLLHKEGKIEKIGIHSWRKSNGI